MGDLVPVQQMVKSPPRPGVPLALAVVAFAVVVVLAFVGVGSGSSLGGTLPPGAVEVSGVPLRSGAVPSLDLSNPVVVRVLANGPAAAAAQLSLVLLGHQAFQSRVPLVSEGNGVRTAHVDLSKARYVVTGHATAQVDLLKDGPSNAAAVGYWRFIAQLSQPAWLNVEGIALIVLVLFSLAYIEQFARSLWRGRRRPTATAGRTIVALGGVTMVGIAWLAAWTAARLSRERLSALCWGLSQGLPRRSRARTGEAGPDAASRRRAARRAGAASPGLARRPA